MESSNCYLQAVSLLGRCNCHSNATCRKPSRPSNDCSNLGSWWPSYKTPYNSTYDCSTNSRKEYCFYNLPNIWIGNLI